MVSNIKILVIGEVAVGKTSITTRYTTGAFKDSHLMTIGPNFILQDYKSNKGNNYRLSIWDTVGQVTDRKIVECYYKDAKGALLVFSIVNRKSFDVLDYWFDKVKSEVGDISFILVGNKVDLLDERVVSREEGEIKAEKYGIPYIETSAKVNQNINQVFDTLVKEIIKMRE